MFVCFCFCFFNAMESQRREWLTTWEARKATQGKGYWTRAWRVSRSRNLEGRQVGERVLLGEKTTHRAWRCGRTWHVPVSSSRWLRQKLGERRLGKKSGRAGEAAGMTGRQALRVRSLVYHTKGRHALPLVTRERAQKRSEDRLINHLESHAEHKERISLQEPEQRTQKAAPLLNCRPLYLPVRSRRGLGLWIMKGKNTEKHKSSSVAATWCQPTPVHTSPWQRRQKGYGLTITVFFISSL